MTELSVDDCQLNEDVVVVMQFQRLVNCVPSFSYCEAVPSFHRRIIITVCTGRSQARQDNEDRRVLAASDHGRTSS